MFIFKNFWAVIALIISLGISSSNKDFNQDLYAFLIENNTSSFLISQKGDLIIN
jgi:hypothetical protein